MNAGRELVTILTIVLVTGISIAGFNDNALFNRMIFWVRRVREEREWYRLITSNFFHASWVHLLFNMMSFYFFAGNLESAFGARFVLITFLGSAIAGDLVALALNWKNPWYRAVGSSGGVSGIIFASIFLLPGGSVIVMPIPVPIPSWLYAILFVLFSLYGMGSREDSIGHEAHLGGALAGIVLTLFLHPAIVYTQSALLAAVTVPILLFFVLMRKKR